MEESQCFKESDINNANFFIISGWLTENNKKDMKRSELIRHAREVNKVLRNIGSPTGLKDSDIKSYFNAFEFLIQEGYNIEVV